MGILRQPTKAARGTLYGMHGTSHPQGRIMYLTITLCSMLLLAVSYLAERRNA